MSQETRTPCEFHRLPVANELARAALHRMFQAFLDIALPDATTVRDGDMLWLELSEDQEREAEKAVTVFRGLKGFLDVDLEIEVELSPVVDVHDDSGCRCPICEGFGPDGEA